MEFRWFPKLLLWGMLAFSCLGAVATLLKTEADPLPTMLKRSTEQQMAIHAALGFTREWMHWDGEELMENRMKRLQPYVNPDSLVRMATLQTEKRTNRQDVIATEFVSLSTSNGSHYTVRVRVIALNPERIQWEADVLVWAQFEKGAAIAEPPLFRPLQEPSPIPEMRKSEASASSDTKQRMRPVVENFLRSMCEGEDVGSLFNYMTTTAKLTPLEGRLLFVKLERLEATGANPYQVTVTFSVEDVETGFQMIQVWKLGVTEENGKFFVDSLSV